MIYCSQLGYSSTLSNAFNSGFGNQLFQISAALGLSKENNDVAIFPPWKFNEFFKNGIITLNPSEFKIKYEYHDPEFKYIKIPYQEGIDLKGGYYQSEKYFSHCVDFIIETFTLKKEYEISIKNKWFDLLKTNNVSIHVRRGDYLPKQDFHPCPSMNYFNESLKYIESLINIDNILVFSDDIKWCKENFTDTRCTFIENQNEIEDMYLMSYCNHNIITNSSFSWWGSWLNKNPNKIVCAPSIWFGKNGYNNWSDIYYEKIIII